jgi:hypothetical protein
MACDKIVIRSRAEHSDKLWTPFVYSSRQSCRNKRMCACNQTLGPFTTAPRLLHTVCWHKSCFLQTTFKERKTHIENVPSKHNCNCSLNIGSFQNPFKLSQKNELRFPGFRASLTWRTVCAVRAGPLLWTRSRRKRRLSCADPYASFQYCVDLESYRTS